MDVGADLIGMVKTTTKGFCNETIENITKDCPGGSYLVSRSNPMVPGGRTLISVGYKYNMKNVLYFIITYNAGSTKTGLPYLSK